MHFPKERIAYLLENYTAKTATAQEEQELMEWLHEAQDDSALKTYIENLWNSYQVDHRFNHVNWDNMFNSIVECDKVYTMTTESKNKIGKWVRIAVAAAIIIFVISGTYWIWVPKNNSVTISNKTQPQFPVSDVAPPATNKATLTLANGKVIVLENFQTGSLAAKGVINASMVKEGELAYTPTPAVMELHTLQVPKGSKPMHLQLADGSVVWLNAASSITFPNVFAGSERKVSVTGEAYFEVKHDANHPFIVSKGEMQVRVLGTKFNVNAYDDEKDLKITLLEGSVKVLYANKETTLKPGQQARLANYDINLHNEVNMEEVMAWKNGLFEFNDTDIQTIMRQMERWYDVEVVFEGTITQHFNGTIQRQVNASRLLNMLEKTGGIRYSIEGKKVVIKKY